MNTTSPILPLSRRHALRHVATAFAAITAAQGVTTSSAHESADSKAVKVTELSTRELAGHPESEVHMVLVEYAGGGSSPAHQHAGPVFVYVLEGAVEMQITGGALTTLRKGEIFYEPPGAVHLVSRNASAKDPAKLLAFIIGDKGTPATGPVSKH